MTRVGGQYLLLVQLCVGAEPPRLVCHLGADVGKLLGLDTAVTRHVEQVEGSLRVPGEEEEEMLMSWKFPFILYLFYFDGFPSVCKSTTFHP